MVVLKDPLFDMVYLTQRMDLCPEVIPRDLEKKKLDEATRKRDLLQLEGQMLRGENERLKEQLQFMKGMLFSFMK